ncbi:acyltransferase [Olivibacter sp. SDN3]|uniref:acyltransferase family protein n=1 Tax=Olivibacter sp. SDN3 TaxID=2764720 RepID=UPI00165142A5|nr:acyltransferase [Olivibacter sp. SDN3]QNL52039.1 acyltransferase [Olivibacter sp. SDN3]
MALKLDFTQDTLANRDKGIETLRGIAIILMVAGHVIGNDQRSGLKVPEDSWFRYFYYSFQYLRMPLFTVISGFVYAMKPIKEASSRKKFIDRKISRLLLPFFIAVTFLAVFQLLIPGTNNQMPLNKLWQVYVFPYAQFWFVQGIFVVFILISFLDSFGAMKAFRGWLTVFLLSVLLFYSDIVQVTFFSLDKVPFLLMFFLLGLGMKRYYHYLFSSQSLKYIGTGVFLIAVLCQQFVFFTPEQNTHNIANLLTIVVGISGAFLLILTRFYYAPLAWIGNYAYEIFLYHSFGTAGCRILLRLLGVSNLSVYFFFCLAVGIAFPIIFRLLCNRHPLLPSILFGERRKKVKKEEVSKAPVRRSSIPEYEMSEK